MPATEKKLAYQKERNRATGYADQKKYAEKALKRIAFDLNRTTDRDILEYLETIENRQGYLKALIRADMTKNASPSAPASTPTSTPTSTTVES